jgi:hypothetical protein
MANLTRARARLTISYLWLVSTAFFLVAKPVPSFSASQPAQLSADQLVREVVENEVKVAESDHSRWMYRQHHVDDETNVEKECIDSTHGAVCRRLAENGRPLSPEDQEKEKERLLKLGKDPEQQMKLQQARKKDNDKALNMLKMLPEAFQYQYEGTSGNLVRLRFVPNPNFDPPNREARVFHDMVGFMWVDPNAKRIEEISGKLIKDVDFGFGLLGRLYRGGTFHVKRADVGYGHWETTLLDVKIRGKALFFKTIKADQQETTDNFKRVDGNPSVAQAAKMLQDERSFLQASNNSGAP